MSQIPKRNPNEGGGFCPIRNVVTRGGVPDLTLQAIMRKMECLFDRRLEPIEEHLDRVEERGQREGTPQNARRGHRHPIQNQEDFFEPSDNDSDQALVQSVRQQGHRNHNLRERTRVDDSLKNIKMATPPFQGKNDPAYLEWEKKIELVFECHNYSESKKVKLTAIEFSDYAIVWWDQLMTSRRRNRERPISTWTKMKVIMRKRFILTYYHRDLYQHLQILTQGNRSVEEYYKEMEVAMI
ncbi:uncharacterized protein [Gossypium hirsutum]|uniref:Retrotransposon gag domain-containing protein n=1 Tax=Gossypium hirsutum TaxID=3635 RepID=A0ABM2YNH3_GOSHI|nr:uncharacterized protein LOC121205982 [Gossypium hirsutum]